MIEVDSIFLSLSSTFQRDSLSQIVFATPARSVTLGAVPGAFGRIEPLHDLRPCPHLRILETVRVRLAAILGGCRPSSSYLGPFVKLLVYLYPGQPWVATSLCLSPRSIPKPPAVPPTIAPLSLLESVGASFLPSYWNSKKKVKITKGIGTPEESRILSCFVHSSSPSA